MPGANVATEDESVDRPAGSATRHYEDLASEIGVGVGGVDNQGVRVYGEDDAIGAEERAIELGGRGSDGAGHGRRFVWRRAVRVREWMVTLCYGKGV